MTHNPFKADIFPDGWPALAGENLLHGAEWEQLLSLLKGRGELRNVAVEGRVVLLKAPRAGYGKSHLLAALTDRLAPGAAVIAPVWEVDREFCWRPMLWNAVEKFHAAEIGHGKATRLDRLARHLFGLLNIELIRTKKVPCANPEAAISALQQRSLELFDWHDPRQAVGKWFAEHFERLLPVTSSVLSQRSGLSLEAAATWLRALCAYTQDQPDNGAARWEQLRWALQQGDGAGRMAGGMQILTAPTLDEKFDKDRLIQFLQLASLEHPVLLVFDHLDAVHGQPEATLRVASLICEFRQLLPQALIVLSANQDLWTGSFQKFLPSAMEDRLTEETMELGELSLEQSAKLLRLRLRLAGVGDVEGEAFLATLTLPPGGGPRTLLRHAARAWDAWCRRDQVAVTPAEEARPNFSSLLPPSGGGTSFQQLKLMLEKLRMDRAAAGKLSTTVGMIPPHVESVHQHEITEQFRQLRQRLLGAKPLRIDHDLLCHLLDVCGKRLAVVQAAHVPLPGSSGPGVMVWHTRDAEILFGTEAAEDRPYWQALLAHAHQRHAVHMLPRPHLAIFSASQEPVDLQKWLPAEEATLAVQTYVDLISLDPEALATLYAADELLHSAEHATEGGPTPEEVFFVLAPHVESFWKRLTRVRPQTTEDATSR